MFLQAGQLSESVRREETSLATDPRASWARRARGGNAYSAAARPGGYVQAVADAIRSPTAADIGAIKQIAIDTDVFGLSRSDSSTK